MRQKISIFILVLMLVMPITLSAQNSGGTWYVQEHINDFDGYTTYSFFVKGSGVSQKEAWLFVGYDKYSNSLNSTVRAGVIWGGRAYYSDTLDIKTDNGDVFSKRYSYATWSTETGYQTKRGSDNSICCYYTNVNPGDTRDFLNLFTSNKMLTIRNNSTGTIFRFNCSGLWEFMASKGISQTEIQNALANEDF